MAKPFKTVEALRPRRSVFDLSYSKLMTGDMGKLYPILHDEMIPGDKFKIGNEIVVRLNPLVAPILHQIDCYVHYFFVPYRILDEQFEEFITGGVDGDSAVTLPRWSSANGAPSGYNHYGTLWDYLGFPIQVEPLGAHPIDYVRRAYYKIWNDFYRDETLQNEIDITDQSVGYDIMNRNWEKDYFTSALLTQQRGTAPSLPISGTTFAEFPNDITIPSSLGLKYSTFNDTVLVDKHGTLLLDEQTFTVPNSFGTSATQQPLHADGDVVVPESDLNNNVVDLSNATTFNVADLRLAFQIQKWLERNNRAGARYTEFLRAHFGVSPRDERLQRPEYIGGSKAPVIVSEVLQTSKTDTNAPLGRMGGHGISVSSEYCGSYFAQEFGIVMGIMSIMPKPVYYQGINRQWLRTSKYDFFFPEFAHLSEQGILNAELVATDNLNDNVGVFGFQGRHDEMRYKPNMCVSQMRGTGTFNYWNLCRIFTSVPGLNETFIKCDPRKDSWAVPSEPAFLISVANLVKAIRPIPISSEPGLIDHN